MLLPRGHPATRSSALTLHQLAREPWLASSVDSAWFRLARHACQAAGFDPAVGLASDDYVAVQTFVAAGLGVALVPGPGPDLREHALGKQLQLPLLITERPEVGPAATRPGVVRQEF